MVNKWTEEEMEYIKNNYTELGMKICAAKLNRTTSSVSHKALKLGVKKRKKRVYMDHFYDIILPEISYFLGILWADGYVDDKYSTGLTLAKNDMDELKSVLSTIGEWTEYVKTPENPKHKVISMQRITNKEFHDFLIKHDFRNKSVMSPFKILSKIPELLHPYFWRGFFDGDGCIHIQKNPAHNFGTITLTGTYSQNWDSLTSCLTNLNIKYHHVQVISHNKHSCSRIILSNKKSITAFGSYIYGVDPSMGLSRKYKIFLDFINKNEQGISFQVS